MTPHSKPLYDPKGTGAASPEQQVSAVHRFLRRCHRWAEDREIPKRTQAVQDGAGPESVAKLNAWVSYKAFLEHTLEELEHGALDHWFRED